MLSGLIVPKVAVVDFLWYEFAVVDCMRYDFVLFMIISPFFFVPVQVRTKVAVTPQPWHISRLHTQYNIALYGRPCI